MKLSMLIIIFITSQTVFAKKQMKAKDKTVYSYDWVDSDETVYIIQNKEYPSSGKVGFDLTFGYSDNSAYQSTQNLSGGLTFYFSEVFSLDISYKKYFNSNNSDLKSLLNDNSTKPLIRTVNATQMLSLNWLPFYGKINTFNTIFYFYWGVGIGPAYFQTESNHKTFLNRSIPLTLSEENKFGAGAKTFVKFFLNKSWNFGFEFANYGFNAIDSSNGTTGLITYRDLSMQLGYIF